MRNQRLLFLSIALSSLNACYQMSPAASVGTATTAAPATGIASPASAKGSLLITGTPPTTGQQDVLYTFTPLIANSTGTLKFSVQNAPSWASFSTTAGTFSGSPTSSGTFSNIIITVTNGASTTSMPAFGITVAGNPLKQYQWHLTNTGQSAFAMDTGTVGVDLNLAQTISNGIWGTGVRIALSDTGTEIRHESLSGNVLQGESRDYRNNSVAPYLGDPTPTTKTGDHGTSVAGIAAAQGWTNLGVRGVAPGAHFATFNYLESTVNQTSTLSTDQLTGNFDVFNESWGLAPTQDGVIPSYYLSQLVSGVSSQRSGKGSLYVKAAGNSFVANASYPWMTGDANGDYFNDTPYVIVVGAINAKGIKSSYASVGSSLWISGFGGEFGDQDPAIVTTDQSTCSEGYSVKGASINSFEAGNSVNPNCNYTSAFNGTSSATPMITGAVALMLQANSGLGWRDVKHILASTASEIDPSYGPVANRAVDPAGYVWDYGWVTNAAGYHFSDYYGFGKVNVDAAVKMAQSYTSTLGTFKSITVNSTALNLPIPDDSATGVTNTINQASSVIIESVQLQISITHPYTGDLGIQLTSPGGTKSILLHANNAYTNSANFSQMKFESNAFYGENALGNWTVKVVDGSKGETGTLTNWALTVYGH